MVVVVVLIAVGNTTAKKRQERAALAAADRVDAVLLTASGEAHDHDFEVTLVVLNRGTTTITVKAGRVEPALYDATPFEDVRVAPGATEQLTVPFDARCPGPTQDPAQSVELVVPIAPASGRLRDVRTPLEPGMMWDLSRRACGYLNADEAAVPAVRAVTSTRYNVRFRMLLSNVSDRPFVLLNVTSPGLAVAVMGGTPLAVAPHGNVDLAVSVELPACSRLPSLGPRGRGGPQYATIVLDLRDDTGAVQTKSFLPNADLAAAFVALRSRICPRSLQPSGTRPRGF
ncbi:MAG: hypothetical protein QOI82_2675 [Actinomycetota bacterium]|nr:hypothetical protein [Actinomycetota bacterium]